MARSAVPLVPSAPGGGRIELGPPLVDLRNAVLRGPCRLQFGGGHLELRPALGILIGTDHLANLERRNAVSGGSPAALGDLDKQTVEAVQVRRSNPHATQLGR